MQRLAEISVKRPVFAAVLIFALVALGIFALPNLGIERYPNVDIPYVVVTTVVPGASAAEIETDVSEVVEEQVNTISGIETLTSVSYDGYSQVTVQFKLEKDGDTAAQEVRAAVDLALADLPKEADKPVVSKERTDDIPIIQFTLSAPNATTRDLTEYARRRLLTQLQGLSGVGGIAIVGGRARQMNLETDSDRLAAFGLSVADVERAVRSQNTPVPGGTVDQGANRLALRTDGRVLSLPALAAISIKKAGGRTVHLRDVADVYDSEAEAKTLASVDGVPALLLSVRKQSGANTVTVAQSFRDRLAEIAPNLPQDYRTEIVRDESIFVKSAVGDVQTHLVLGSILAAVVVLIFLKDWRSTVIAAIAIPASIISTFALMQAQGFTLNVLTLLALTLAVGIVIDDAILVLENIVRFQQEKGMDGVTATLAATKEIGLAVLATTLSLVAVFAPVALIPGLVGRFLRSFGLTMTAAILVSLFVAFTVTPMLCSRWLKGRPVVLPGERSDASSSLPPLPLEKEGGEGNPAHHQDWLTPIENLYARILRAAVKPGRRWITVLAALATIASTVPLGIAANKTFLPQDDQSQFQIAVRTREGTSLTETGRVLEQIAADVRVLPDVRGTVVTVGEISPNRGTILVRMPEKKERRNKTTQFELQNRVSSQILRTKYRSVDALATSSDPLTGGVAAIQYVLTGPDRAPLAQVAERIVSSVGTASGIVYARTTAYSDAPEARATIDRERAADLGVTSSDIALALRTLSAGEKVGRYAENGRTYDIVLRAKPDVRTDARNFANFTVPATEGIDGLVPLSQVVTFREDTGVTEIARYARQNEVRILVQPAPGVSTETVQARLQAAIDREKLPAGARGFWEGDSKEMEKTFAGFVAAFALSVVFMYLILAAQFESWLHPITILLSLPLCIPFALLPIVLTGDSINLFSLLGMLVLFGIVKKNSILQVDHADGLRASGMGRDEAIVQSSQDRLRPILMTTIAFVAGMIPLALSHEAGAETNRSISVTVIGGQLLSLALTLIATPVFYSVFDDLTQAMGRLRKRSGGAKVAVMVALCLLPGVARGQEEDTIRTVDEAVALALRVHPEIRIAAERQTRARLSTRQLRAGLLAPQIFASLSYTRLSNANALGGATSSTNTSIAPPPNGGALTGIPPGETRVRQADPPVVDASLFAVQSVDLNVSTAQVGASLPVDITGTLRAGVNAGRLNEQIAVLDTERTAQQVALTVRVATYELLRAEAIAQVRDAALTRAEEQTRINGERSKEGVVSEFDRLRVLAEEKQVRQEAISARTSVEVARNDLFQRIGIPGGTVRFRFKEDVPEVSIDQNETDTEKLFARAMAQRPEAILALRTETRARLATRFAGRTQEPGLALSVGGVYNGNQAGFGFGGSSVRGTGTVNATLTIPLDDGGATRAAVQSARSEEREAALRKEQYLVGIRAEIESAVLALRDARARKRLAESAREDARKAEAIAQVRFASGVGTRLELLDAQNTLTQAQTNAAGAGYDVRITQAQLARAVGDTVL
ncbi:MAG: efflux RND transporter permease subunit [Fibrella sp.]|nr:efflux RND transporter permease subunit [Armatimonadota bacterium]